MVYSGADIYRLMDQNAAGSQKLDAAKDASELLANGYRDVQDDLMKSQKSLDSFWFGSGAENASGGMQPLVDSAIEYGGNLDRAKVSTSSMSFVFNNTRNGLKPMEPSRPECNGITDYLSIGASDAEEAAAQWDADNKHNIQKYQSYQQSKDMVKPDLVLDYKPVQPKLSGQQPTTTEPSASVGAASTSAAGSGGGGYSGGIPAPTGGGGYASGAGSYSPPAGYTPAASASQTPGAPGSHIQQPPAVGAQPSRPDNSTSAAGYAPLSGGVRPGPGSAGFGPPGGSGFGPQGSGGGFGPGGSAGGGYGSGGGGYGAGAYGSGGFGPRGSAPEGPAGGGRASGSAPPASGGSAPRPSPGGTPSSGGAPAGGRAPMMGGAGAGRGQGGEAEEHERKYVLPTDDPDDIFGGIPEGSQVVPPVIGE